MNRPLSLLEFYTFIKKLPLHKAPEKNGVFPNAIKALNDKNISYLFDICADYFNNDLSTDDWEIGCSKILPKRGNLSDPNNWREINLLDVVSKIMSLVITFRLQHTLKIEGTPAQFGASPDTGCPDGSFSLKTWLQICKEHDLRSWVVFADLIKAFDTINHEMMFKLLSKFGVPNHPLRVIKKLFKDFKIKLKIGKCKDMSIDLLE